MAIEVIAKVMEYDLPPREKFILMLYANYSNPEGEGVWPSQSTIALISGYTRQTINEVTKVLNKGGLLLDDGKTKYNTCKWKINTKWKGQRSDIESVGTSLQVGVNTSLQTPVGTSLHNTSLDTLKKPSGDFLSASLGIKRIEFKPDVDDLLQAFVKKFDRQPTDDEVSGWEKAARAWNKLGVTPNLADQMFDYCREKGTVIKSPFSITFAYDELRNKPDDLEEWDVV